MTTRRVCFVTGTRAEFGLMRSTLRAFAAHPKLSLQIVATGMHLDAAHGRSVDAICEQGWKVDAVVDWSPGQPIAVATGRATAALTEAYETLQSDVVLVVGDRVEAFAAATAGHLSGRIVAHVHGGDRALGQVDDALRHAITKLSHVHFPATPGSAGRIARLGEDEWRIHQVGAPGIDGIVADAASPEQLAEAVGPLPAGRFALLVLHPTRNNEAAEHVTANHVLDATLAAGLERVVVIHPNNDPGGRGIARCWDERADDPRLIILRDARRDLFLGLMRDATMLIGNSSAGIIEAASFGLPVIDIGPRQLGREHGENVIHVEDESEAVAKAVKAVWNGGDPRRVPGRNVYGGEGTGQRIADVLASLAIDDRLRRKLIVY